MSAHTSIWSGPDHSSEVPRLCPHCGEELAHPDDLQDNDEIDATGLFEAYRRHRQRHYLWGDDPRDDARKPGDPYLADYYDTDRSALWEEDDDGVSGDPDEVVGKVFDVEIVSETRKKARVVAPTKARAKEKVKWDELPDGEDLTGSVPEYRRQMEIHKKADSVRDVTRSESDLAERMEGWPW